MEFFFSKLIPSISPTMSIITLLFFILILKKIKSQKSPKLPPGPWSIPLLGSMHHLLGYIPHQRMRDLSKIHGPIMHLKFGETSNIIISSPEIAKHIYKTHDINFSQRPLMLSAQGISYDYKDITFAAYGDYWRQLRKISTMELLTLKRVRSFRTIREEEAEFLVQSIASSEQGKPVNFSWLITYTIYRIVSRAAFRKIWHKEDVFLGCLKKLKMELGRGVSIADAYPSIKWLRKFSSIKARADKLQEPIDNIFQAILDEHKRARKGEISKTSVNDDEKVEDLVDVLLNLQEEGGFEFPLEDDTIKAMIMDAFVAGTDTSSTAIVWGMAQLMRHPKVLAKVQAEIRKKYNAKGTVDEENLQELEYFSLVVKETLRLHPPAPLLVPRECRESVEIAGYDIPAKSKIMVNVWAMARDESIWEDAAEFKPERFQGSSLDYKGNNYEYIPFGAGRRICPGITLGIANIELPFAKLLFHYDWKLGEGMKPEDVDMEEDIGASAKRKNDLYIYAVPYVPPTP
ncbi:cytochrome P450 family 71 subfamily B polypeptide 23 [Euphorbia peplus]|nr:jolkinol E 5,6-epoxidase [Euphorbia peplus]WCJ37123.1 cytochrome P450 family 71 subfamily B polypeptide 23 [Euphorbia peplus]